MGKEKVIDKTISPAEVVRALQSGSITVAQAQAMYNGVIPIGGHRGTAAILDLDLLVSQPLVLAEQQHIMGILDGRLEDHDAQTITILNGAEVNESVVEALVVPAGEVWYVTVVETTVPAMDGGTPAINWYCSLWEVPESPLGQPFHSDPLVDGAGAAEDWFDEFHGPALVFAVKNQPSLLRLPAGTAITFVATNLLVAATGDMVCTGKLYGFIGKALVD